MSTTLVAPVCDPLRVGLHGVADYSLGKPYCIVYPGSSIDFTDQMAMECIRIQDSIRA